MVLLSQTFDAAEISEGGFTALTAETPLEGLYQVPLLLRITADSQLDRLGMVWDVGNEMWNKYYSAARSYVSAIRKDRELG